jgi:phage terminase small subunit
MTERAWKKRIEDACKEAGTYQSFFGGAVDTLANLMQIRDEAIKQYKESGANPIIQYTNSKGGESIHRNPCLQAILDVNAQAISYWKELGLTAKSYKQMFGDIQSSGGGFDEYINQVMGDVDG